MKRSSSRTTLLQAAATIAIAAALASPSDAAEPVPVASLVDRTHFHGLAVDSTDPSRLLLATHHGLFAVGRDGMATPLSDDRSDYMGFTPHPSDPATLYASGHPTGGGNLGVIVSGDAGQSWARLADGANGPVDFHQLDASPADPQILYGAHAGELQVSRDAGRSWAVVGRAPEGLIDLAASAKDPNLLYAATQKGLLASADGGKTWKAAYWVRQPATMVEVTPEGDVYAFVVGSGLIRTKEPDLTWDGLGGSFGQAVVIHFAADPNSPERLFAVTFEPQGQKQALVASGDAGKTWSPLGAR